MAVQVMDRGQSSELQMRSQNEGQEGTMAHYTDCTE